MAVAVIETEDVSTFKSPERILVRSLRRSRDKWKAKYVAIKTEIKRYKNQASDARRSREQWKNKFLAPEARVQESCFGTFKALEQHQSRSGFTSLILSLGALVSKTTSEIVSQALEAVRTKDV